MFLKKIQKVAHFTTRLYFNKSIKFRQVPIYQFSEKDDGPQGFEKFKRKSKKETQTISKEQENQQKKEMKTAETGKNSEQEIKVNLDNQEKKKPEQEVKQAPKATENEPEKQESDSLDKTEKKQEPTNKKKIKFTYNAKFFFKKDKKDDKKDQSKEENKDEKKFDLNQFWEQNKNDKSSQQKFAVMLGLTMAGLGLHFYNVANEADNITYKELVQNYLDKDQVKAITIVRVNNGTHYNSSALISCSDQRKVKIVLGNVDHFLENLEKLQLEKGKDQSNFIPVDFQEQMYSGYVLDQVLNNAHNFISIILAVAAIRFIRSSRKNGGGSDIFGVGKSNAKVYGGEAQIKIRFKDVAGLDEAKLEIQEFVDFLKKPKKYKDMGAKIPKGALLAGPPGTGKTLMAKACAGEASVPFFYISGSDFVEMFVGVGASRVRDLFKQAKLKSPSIIFIDEIDAVGRKRESRIGGNDERDNTLNQLLVEMDGFGTDAGVIILAATNRKELLDPALTRPGRFDRTIEVTLPDISGRKSIFMVHLKPLKLDPSKTIEEYAKRLSTLTPGFSGADIANLCNEAAILAARKNKKTIETIDFEMASERVLAGLEKKKIVSEEERKIVAIHESGHAIVSWFLAGGAPLLKLTIIPRSKGSLGFAQYLPSESSLETKEELLDRLCSILGGRCAEEVFFGRITTGAYDDLKKAYELVYTMVSKYGMSENIGYVGYIESDYNKTYSDQTNKIIDDEIKRIIHEATTKTMDLVKKYRQQIQNLSDTLLEKETLDLRQIKSVLGERPFPAKSSYKAYLETTEESEKEVLEQAKRELEQKQEEDKEKEKEKQQSKTDEAVQ